MLRSSCYGIVLTLCTCFLASATMAQDQPASNLAVGLRGGATYLFNTSTIPVISGSTDCGVFGNGTSIGYYGGLEVDYAILGPLLELTGSLTYAQRPASLQTMSTDNFEVLDPRSNEYVSLTRQHDFTSSLGYVMVEVGIRMQPVESLPLYVRVFGDAGNPLVDGTYSQTETLVHPDGVLFPDGTQRRTTGSGDFPGLGTSYGVSGGLGFVLNLSKHIQLAPEVAYRYGINTITTEAEWKQSWVAGGLHVRYRFFDDEPPPKPVEPPPPPPQDVIAPPPPPPVVVVPPATIVALTTQPLEIRETIVTQTFPLLPYVFFDSASSALQSKYVHHTSIASFSEEELPRETLPIYYQLFDVIGSRMLKKSNAKLIVTGTTDGIEGSSSASRKSLAMSRAQTVVDYIRDRWKVPASQFVIRTSEKPSLTSNELYAEGIQENRRVELEATDPGLLTPIVHRRFMEYIPVQPRQEFRTTVLHAEQAREWTLAVDHHGKSVAARTQGGAPPERISFDLNQELTNQIGPLIHTTDTLNAHLTVMSGSATPATATTPFPIVKTVENYEVSRLSLIVFDYDKSEISRQNMEMMSSVVNASVREGSSATIVGSTDRLGELSHNLDLSRQRALSVERAAHAIAPLLTVTKVEGVGPSVLPYDNSLPEGRFYCRTVSLTITTPLR